jgi:hypothetical protein
VERLGFAHAGRMIASVDYDLAADVNGVQMEVGLLSRDQRIILVPDREHRNRNLMKLVGEARNVHGRDRHEARDPRRIFRNHGLKSHA